MKGRSNTDWKHFLGQTQVFVLIQLKACQDPKTYQDHKQNKKERRNYSFHPCGLTKILVPACQDPTAFCVFSLELPLESPQRNHLVVHSKDSIT